MWWLSKARSLISSPCLPTIWAGCLSQVCKHHLPVAGGFQKDLMGKSATGDVTGSVAAADLSEAEWFGLYQRALWWFVPAELWRIGRNLCQTTLDAPTCFWDSFQEEISLKEHRLPLPCGILVTEGVNQHFISVGVFLNYFLKQFFKVICLCKFWQCIRKADPTFPRNSCEQSN